MPDSLSIAIGTVLSLLDIAEADHEHVEGVTLIMLDTTPTNVIEFTMHGRVYEVLVTEKRSVASRANGHLTSVPDHRAPSTSRVSLRSYMERSARHSSDTSSDKVEHLTLSL